MIISGWQFALGVYASGAVATTLVVMTTAHMDEDDTDAITKVASVVVALFWFVLLPYMLYSTIQERKAGT